MNNKDEQILKAILENNKLLYEMNSDNTMLSTLAKKFWCCYLLNHRR